MRLQKSFSREHHLEIPDDMTQQDELTMYGAIASKTLGSKGVVADMSR